MYPESCVVLFVNGVVDRWDDKTDVLCVLIEMEPPGTVREQIKEHNNPKMLQQKHNKVKEYPPVVRELFPDHRRVILDPDVGLNNRSYQYTSEKDPKYKGRECLKLSQVLSIDGLEKLES